MGTARSAMSDEQFREMAARAIREYSRRPPDEQVLERLPRELFYVPGAVDQVDLYESLAGVLRDFEEAAGRRVNRVFYLATAPRFFPVIVRQLGAHGLEKHEDAEVRVVIEKPFGTSLAEAQQLNRDVLSVFDERQVFRIDHYLGKETVQNLLAFRFANGMFEPWWNRNFIDYVQITAAEDVGVGSRAEYYDTVGRVPRPDPEPPAAAALPRRDGAAGRLQRRRGAQREGEGPARHSHAGPGRRASDRCARPVRAGHRGRRAGPRIPRGGRRAPDSNTETYAAVRCEIDSWRWAGVPFYLRTGKRLARKVTEIAVMMKPVPHLGFAQDGSVGVRPNVLVLTIQPNEGVSLSLAAKIPGTRMRIRPVNMEFLYGTSFLSQSPEAYERLILDVMRGDATLFTRNDEVEEQWRVCDPIVHTWHETTGRLPQYPAGSQGPAEADELLRGEQAWRRI